MCDWEKASGDQRAFRDQKPTEIDAMTFGLYAAAAMIAVSSPQSLATAPSDAASQKTISADQLHNYVEAFVRITALRRAFDQQRMGLPEGQRSELKRRYQADVARALNQSDLDTAQFNSISKAVERDPALQRQVRQRVMEKVVGV